jgi:hypothetical protein
MSLSNHSINQCDLSQSLAEMGKASHQTVDRLGTPPPSTEKPSTSMMLSLPSRTKPSEYHSPIPVNRPNAGGDSQDDQLLHPRHIGQILIELEDLCTEIEVMKRSVSNYSSPKKYNQQRQELPCMVEFYKYCESLLSQIEGDPVIIGQLGEKEIQRWQQRMFVKGCELGRINHQLDEPCPVCDLPPSIADWN